MIIYLKIRGKSLKVSASWVSQDTSLKFVRDRQTAALMDLLSAST